MFSSKIFSANNGAERVKGVELLYESEPIFFVAKGNSLYYVGGGKQLNFILLCIDLLRSVYYVSEALLYL